MHEIHLTIQKQDVYLDLTKCNFSWQMEDIGIGPYEYWGARYTDVRIVPCIQDIELGPVYTKADETITQADILEEVKAILMGGHPEVINYLEQLATP